MIFYKYPWFILFKFSFIFKNKDIINAKIIIVSSFQTKIEIGMKIKRYMKKWVFYKFFISQNEI